MLISQVQSARDRIQKLWVAGSCASSDTSVLAALRNATRAQHERVESLLRLAGHFSLREYAQAIHALALFTQAWEPLMLAALPPRLLFWIVPGVRLARLRPDLATVGLREASNRLLAAAVAPGAGPVNASCAPALRLQLADTPAALGSLYVIEGSALGGQVVARQAHALHGLGPACGAAYFSGAGQEAGPRWRRLRALLEDELQTPAEIERACDAARQTFDALAMMFLDARNHVVAA